MKKTFYEFLGIDPDASAEAVEAAYRQRLDELNRRPVQDAGARLAVREAYFSLSHPNRRAAYDALLKQPVGRVAADRNESARAASTWTAFCRWIVAAAVLLGAGAWWGRHHTAPLPGAKVAAVRPVEPPVAQVPAAPAPPVEMPQAETTAAAPVGVRSAEDIFALASASIARVNVLDASGRAVGSGSAVVIEPATLITNCHVALRGAGLNVRIGAETLPANIAVADEELDLCRLHVPGLRAPAVKMAKVSELRTGVRVYAIGAPAGLELTLSEGIVSALREVQGGTVIQTTAPISPGSSGGGLFDTSGRLVGITTFQHRFGQNLNFALPADWIAQVRARTASRDLGTGNAPRFVPQQARGAVPERTVLGQWSCRGSVSGRSGTYRFDEDGTLSIATMEGRAYASRFTVSGKVLTIGTTTQAINFSIDEITETRMVLNLGIGERLVCDRA